MTSKEIEKQIQRNISRSVLEGVLALGITHEQIASALSVASAHLAGIGSGETRLSDRQLRKIEEFTGVAHLELSILGTLRMGRRLDRPMPQSVKDLCRILGLDCARIARLAKASHRRKAAQVEQGDARRSRARAA